MVKVLVLIKGWYDSSRECFDRKIYKLEQQEQQEHYKTLLELGEDHVVQAVIDSVNIINESGLITDDKIWLLHLQITSFMPIKDLSNIK